MTLPRKPEVAIIARLADISPREVVGTCLEFWAWASEQSVDGHIDATVTPVSRSRNADVTLVSRSRNGLVDDDLLHLFPGTSASFWSAMFQVGWLKRTTEGGLVVPHFDRWLSNGAKARLQSKKRQARWRTVHASDVTPVSRSRNADVTRAPLLQYSTEEESIVKSTIPLTRTARAREAKTVPNGPETFAALVDRSATTFPALPPPLQPIAQIWADTKGAPPNILKLDAVDALIGRVPIERIIDHLRQFFRTVEPKYHSLPRFVETFNDHNPNGKQRAEKRKSHDDETQRTQRAAIQDAIERGLVPGD